MGLEGSRKIEHKSQRSLRNQVADFFNNCDENTYTYDQVYSTKELMRALQSPKMSDISGRLKHIAKKVLVNKTIHGGEPEINWENVAHVKEVIKEELDRQIMNATGENYNIDPVEIEKIWQEYKQFVSQRTKEKAELDNLFREPPSPYPMPQIH